MASQRQIEANRGNAQKSTSTGPRTEAGRARSRMNAVKHGLSRKLPAAGPADPSVLPLVQAIAGQGVHDPKALSHAEQIVVDSLILTTIRHLRAKFLPPPACQIPGRAARRPRREGGRPCNGSRYSGLQPAYRSVAAGALRA